MSEPMYDYLIKFKEYFEKNDASHLSTEELSFLQAIQKMNNQHHKVYIENCKTLTTDMKVYYEQLRKKKPKTIEPIHENIFNNQFLTSTSFTSFSNKFFNGNASSAAKTLSQNVKTMIATSVTENQICLPCVNMITYRNYVRSLITKTPIENTLLDSINHGRQPMISNLHRLINIIVREMFTSEPNNNFYDFIFNDELRVLITNMKENINYLTPVQQKTNIFKYIAQLATSKGKKTESTFQIQNFFKSIEIETSECNTFLSQSMKDLEILRRIIEQEY